MPLAAPVDPLAGSRRSESGWEKRDAAASARASCSPSCSERASAHHGSQALDAITVTDVSRNFEIGHQHIAALANLSLRVPAGSIVAVIGPNGSGKSTLLRLIGGLLAPDQGEVRVMGELVNGPPRAVGICFQEPRLLPWRSVIDNVALPLELAGMAELERRDHAQAVIELVGLTGFENARPHQLSGGMRQRAAVARALVREPSVLLLDEPFSALDALTRERLDRELVDLWARTGMTMLLVTHDIGEALLLADRVLVLSARPGRVLADLPVAVDRPRDGADSAALGELASQIRALLEASDRTELAA